MPNGVPSRDRNVGVFKMRVGQPVDYEVILQAQDYHTASELTDSPAVFVISYEDDSTLQDYLDLWSPLSRRIHHGGIEFVEYEGSI
ncbi:MAG: hypothetical protein AAF585_16395 [Verrucomicrobiota bacterium]